MYKCEKCGRLFDTPEHVTVRTGVFSEGRAEEIEVGYCPHCGFDMYDNVYHCEICGEYTEDDYCEDCIEDMKGCMAVALENFRKRHGDAKDLKLYDLIRVVLEGWEFE